MTQLPATTWAPPLGILILPIGDPLSALTFRAQEPDVVIVAGTPSRSHPDSPTLAMLMLMPPVPEFTLPGAAGVVPVPLTLVQYNSRPPVVTKLSPLLVAVTGVAVAGLIVVDAAAIPDAAMVNAAAAPTSAEVLPSIVRDDM